MFKRNLFKRFSVPILAMSMVLASISACSHTTDSALSSDTSSKKEVDNTNTESNVLSVYNWGEYIDPEVISMFEEETGIRVNYDMYETNEEMYPRIEKSAASYDCICPSEYMIEKMIKNNLLQEVDTASMKYFTNINKEKLDMLAQVDSGNKYAVPYMCGTVGILYNKTLLDEKKLPYPKTWADLFKEEYKDEILMQNSVRDAFMVALKKNGYSMNSTDVNELDKATDDLIAQKPLVQAYVVDQVRDKMIAGEAAIGVIYSGEVIYIKTEASDNGYEYKYVLPEEGTNVWIDGWVIPKNAKNVENANKWIDFMCREDVARLNAEYITYESPNDAANKILSSDYKLEGDIVEDYTKNNNEVFKYLGDEVDDMYNERWKKIKGQ